MAEDKKETIRIGLAQINPVLGDIPGNQRKILDWLGRARKAGCQIAAFPEMALTGYPPEDLLFKPEFINANLKGIQQIAGRVKDIVAIVGFIDRQDDLYNAAAIMAGGKIQAVYHKHFLPNYSVFDEERYFKAGRKKSLFRLGRIVFGVNICEDIWQPAGPIGEQVAAGANLIINISASPYQRGKVNYKERMLSGRAADYEVYLAYVNLVGGQDELVFDGQSVVFDPEGKLAARAKPFAEDLLTVDLDLARILKRRLREPRLRKGLQPNACPTINLPKINVAPKKEIPARKEEHLSDEAEIYSALVTGTRDYVRKNGFRKVIIGLSGGVDSALTAAIAVDCLGPDKVIGVFMPGRYSASISRIDSEKLAGNLGIEFHIIPIKEIFQAYGGTLKKSFSGRKPDTTEENLQARIRGNILMAFSNKFGYLVLTTGNKSEIATGYCTLYGDMAGGFAVIKDIPKTLVYRLVKYRNGISEIIPERIITRPPSAELRPDQKDSDSLPEYEQLDPILNAYVEDNLSLTDIVEKGYPKETVGKIIRLVDRNEYKRRQAPPGVKITSRAFGKDWRLPITNAYRQ